MIPKVVLALLAAFLSTIVPALAQQAPSAIDGLPAVLPPEVIARDADGHVAIRALKLSSPLRIDGTLDEEVYQQEKPFGGFVQAVPIYGAEQSEPSDVWVMYDDKHIYVACRCWDSALPDKWVVNELRRDTRQLQQNDHFGVSFDTFYDHRNGFIFYTNPLGARGDYSIVDEGSPNLDWNPVWESKTGRFDSGWTVEMAIPFKSLRYRSGPNQVWGIQLRRAIRRNNEWAYLTRVPQMLAGPQAFARISAGGTLIGLDLPPAGKNLEVKPYAIARVTTDQSRPAPIRNDVTGDVGGDVKYGLTANLTADFTVNTDFAQVEVDEQQVNLTRFSLFFPEKRDFFLEGRGVFDFARGGVAAASPSVAATSVQPYLFYSRRIGLDRSREIPIEVGGRLTGKVGPYAVGILNIQTRSDSISATPPTNFTVLRLKRDILRRSSVGAMFTNRSASATNQGSNQAWGVDAALSFFENLGVAAYYARTETLGHRTDDQSYQGLLDYSGDRYGAHLEYLRVGQNFTPEIGFVPREDFGRTYATVRFSPRPAIRAVRKFTWQGNYERFVNGAGALETRIGSGLFSAELENSDVLSLNVTSDYERLQHPATIASVTVPPGRYQFTTTTASYAFGAQRRGSGTLTLQAGGFYHGSLIAIGYTAARVSVLKQLSFEPTVQINRFETPTRVTISRLYRARVDYGFSPLMFASALLQYTSNDRAFSCNLRFRWEYRPGSELFVVYTDERDLTNARFALPTQRLGLKNRAFVVKINRLLRF